MYKEEIEEKVALLKDGQIVEIDGRMFSAIRLDDDSAESPCEFCMVDWEHCIKAFQVCIELDLSSDGIWRLKLEK